MTAAEQPAPRRGRPRVGTRFPITLPDDLRERLEASAAEAGRSLSAEVVARLRESVDDSRWQPGRWWRVVAADGSLWCETSNEREARDAVRPGDSLERQYVRRDEQWFVVD